MPKYLVRVYDDIWPEVVYGPFGGDEDEVEHLAQYFSTVLAYAEDDGIFLLEIDEQGRPSMKAFAHAKIKQACELARTMEYHQMAQDEQREADALEWAEATIRDLTT